MTTWVKWRFPDGKIYLTNGIQDSEMIDVTGLSVPLRDKVIAALNAYEKTLEEPAQ